MSRNFDDNSQPDAFADHVTSWPQQRVSFRTRWNYAEDVMNRRGRIDLIRWHATCFVAGLLAMSGCRENRSIGDIGGNGPQADLATGGDQLNQDMAGSLAARPTRLAFLTQPTSTTPNATMVPAPTVAFEDDAGNIITTTGETRQISASIGGNPYGGVLSGTVSVVPVAGVASFDNLSIGTSGRGYQIEAIAKGADGLLIATSSPFDIVGPPSTARSSVVVTPSTLLADGVAHASLHATILDDNNSPIAGQAVSWSVSGTANTLSATTGSTDSSGSCDATLSSTKAEPKVVTAKVGALTLQAYVTFTRPALSCSAAPNLSTNVFPDGLVADDFNNDGIIDLAVASHGYPADGIRGDVGVFIGKGDGTFANPVSSDVGGDGNIAYDIASGDFNHDGKRDVAVIGDGLAVLLGNGDGKFGVAASYDPGLYPYRIVTADFNRDGNLDLAITTNSTQQTDIAVLLGNNNGTFGAPAHYASPEPTALVAGDFDSDGLIDLATTSDFGNAVYFLRGDGKGAFAAPSLVATITRALAIQSADLDGDSILDLIVGSEDVNGRSTVVPLRGRGDGTFTVGAAYDAGPGQGGAVSLRILDFNRDGHADVVIPNYAGGSAGLLFGIGDGTFAPPVLVAAGTEQVACVSNDFDGDGTPDIAIVAERDYAVSILLGDGSGGFCK